MAWKVASYYVDFTAGKASTQLCFILRSWLCNKSGRWNCIARAHSQVHRRSFSLSTPAAAVGRFESSRFGLAGATVSSLRCRLAEVGSFASCSDFSLPGTSGCRLTQRQQQQRRIRFIRDWSAGIIGAVRRLVRFIRLLLRVVQAATVLLPVVVLYALTVLLNADDDLWCSALAMAASHCGPTAIKFGQWASTRRDLFSSTLCNALSSLQRDAWQHDWRHTEAVLTTRLGHAWQDVCTLDRTPIGSGCVAQVYKGHLFCCCTNKKAIGTTSKRCFPIAVKVLHPGIQETMCDDVSLLRAAARAVEWLVPTTRYLNLTGCVNEFGGCLTDQIDLRLEARNLALFNLKFAGHDTIKFAKPIYPFVATDLLIESLEEGVPVTCYIPGVACNDRDGMPHVDTLEDDAALPRLRKQIASAGLHTVLKMIFEDNFVHADLHPGNISIQLHDAQARNSRLKRWLCEVRSWFGLTTAGEESPYPILILYDCGIVARLRSEARVHFKDVFTAVVLDQGDRVADLFLEHSAVCECTDVITFKRQMAELVHRLRGDAVVLGKIRVGELLGDVFGLLSRNRIRLEKDFVSVIVAIAVIEGLGRSLDPDVDLLEATRHYLVR